MDHDRDTARPLAVRRWIAMLLLAVAPLLLLGPSVLGPRTFVPFDLAQFPPVATKLTDAQLEQVKAHQNTDVSEVPFTFLPEWRFAKQELQAGRLPAWNPYARGGAPLLATAVVGLLYPPNWLLLLPDDPATGLAYGAWFSLAIGGLLMFGLLRAIGLELAPAWFGALAFAFSGTLYANAHFYQRLAALVWLPGMLWAVVVLARRRGRARSLPIAGLAGCQALSWLAGFPAYAAGCSLVAGLFALALAVRAATLRGGRAAGAILGGMALATLLSFALASVQLLPMFAFFPESNRTVTPSPDQIAEQSFDPGGLLGYALPDPFGRPDTTDRLEYSHSPLALLLFDRRRWSDGAPFVPPSPIYNYVEYTVFPGTLVLLLAIAALIGRGPRLRWVALGGLLVLLLLASAPPWLAPLYALPGMRNVPPLRLVGPACALVALLAAIGLASATRTHGRWRWLVLGLGSLALGIASLAGWQWLHAQTPSQILDRIDDPMLLHYRQAQPNLTLENVRAFLGEGVPGGGVLAAGQELLVQNLLYGAVAFALAGLWCLALWRARRPSTVTTLVAVAIVGTVAQQLLLAEDISGGRVLPFAHDDTEVHAFLRQQRDAAAERGGFTVARAAPETQLAIALPPCTLVPEHIRDLDVYTFVDGRSHLPFLKMYGPEQLLRGFWVHALPDRGASGDKLASPYLDLIGVRYLLSTEPLQHAGSEVGPRWSGPHGSFHVYERPHPLPRAFVVPRLRTLDDDDAVLAALVDPGLEPRAAVLVTPQEAARLPPLVADDGVAERTVRFEHDVPDDLVLKVSAGPAGYLVLADTAMSGWSAEVDGKPAPMARGDLWMRTIAIPAGATTVHLHYRTPWLTAGAVVTAVALALSLVLALLGVIAARPRAA